VVVLGHGYWENRFGSDPGVVGRTILVNGQPFEVVGVAPPDFRGPVSFASIPIYIPLMMQPVLEPGFDRTQARGNNMMTAVARLREGQTIERARAVMESVLVQLREEYPDYYDQQRGHTLVLQNEAGIHPMFRNASLGMGSVMMVVVSLLLLIACVNVANLFLARARDRRQEMGLRLSLGAGRGRIVQQLMTEALVFSFISGIVGMVLARLALRVLANIRMPFDGPWDFNMSMDNRVLFFAAAITLGAGFVFGRAPALQAARKDTLSAVKGEGGGGAGRSRASRGLVVVQMALSLLLLISSGLFLRSLQGATEIEPGFSDPSHLAMVSVDPGLQGYDEVRTTEFLDRLTDEVLALPTVTAVGMINELPLGMGGSDRSVNVPGYEFTEGERRSLYYANVREGYLEAMGIRMVEGRTFTRQDDEAGPPVIIVNKRFADRFWPGETAVGKIVETAGHEREVIGVVETGKYRSLGEDPAEFMYLPQRERFSSGMSLVARTASDPQEVLQDIRAIVRNADPDMPVFDVRSMEDHMGLALLPARLGGTVLGLFGFLGLILAAVGIYGVMAYSVAQRKRELGIRVAVGADRARVVRLVLGEGMTLAVIGSALGLAGALAASRLVASLLYNVSAFDPLTFIGVPVLLVGVAFLAVYLPARKAAGIEPMRVLKTD
jgi:predicted permease